MKPSTKQLIHGYFDGTLSPIEEEELNRLTKTDPKIADKLAMTAMLHHSLDSGFRSGSLPLRSGHPNTHTDHPGRKPLLSIIKPALSLLEKWRDETRQITDLKLPFSRVLVQDPSQQKLPKSNHEHFPAHGNRKSVTAGIKVDLTLGLIVELGESGHKARLSAIRATKEVAKRTRARPTKTRASRGKRSANRNSCVVNGTSWRPTSHARKCPPEPWENTIAALGRSRLSSGHGNNLATSTKP
ncbi:MAG: hypothetical protein QNL68_05000 [Akkermansiaceae bacterium]